MTRAIITAEVEDSAKWWEEEFRRHGDLLRSMTSTVTYLTTTDKNELN